MKLPHMSPMNWLYFMFIFFCIMFSFLFFFDSNNKDNDSMLHFVSLKKSNFKW
uniref:ATP synthase F0 subunit 8 n=1 Tax=Gnathostomula armata TaxID=231613 RepID=A0A0F6PZ83_9BILA|nr:ATP synthase F0 subunit 8 [Gnathostomula armata]AKD00021.1 ATP synthase F0 subunit 8 [Gnathostomula armata]